MVVEGICHWKSRGGRYSYIRQSSEMLHKKRVVTLWKQANEVEGIQGAGPQNFILGGWLPQNQLTMVIILPLPSSPFCVVPPTPIYKYKEEKLMKLLCIVLVLTA